MKQFRLRFIAGGLGSVRNINQLHLCSTTPHSFWFVGGSKMIKKTIKAGMSAFYIMVVIHDQDELLAKRTDGFADNATIPFFPLIKGKINDIEHLNLLMWLLFRKNTLRLIENNPRGWKTKNPVHNPQGKSHINVGWTRHLRSLPVSQPK